MRVLASAVAAAWLWGFAPPATAIACLPIKPGSLWLPADKAEAKAAFVGKAERLNAVGKCVQEGSFGLAYGKFYFAVSDGPYGKPYHLRYTREELAR